MQLITTINTKFRKKIGDVDKKIPDTKRGLATKTALNTKINEIKNKIPDICSIMTTE